MLNHLMISFHLVAFHFQASFDCPVFPLSNGNCIPQVLLGAYQLQRDDVYHCLDAALACGYRGIDTAWVYSNEAAIGEALHQKGLLAKHQLRREDIFITSKLAPRHHGYVEALAALDETLHNLQVSYLDLYLIHWPGVQKRSPSDPQLADIRQQSWRALESAQAAGKVKNIGVSNYLISHLRPLLGSCTVRPVVLQVEHHPLLNQLELVQFCQSEGIHYQAYSSLGSANSRDVISHQAVQAIASQVGKTPAQVLLKWAVQQGISVLPRSCKDEHIQQNFAIFDFTLSEEHMKELSNLHENRHFCWDPNTIA